MGTTRHGATKADAKRLGISVAEYCERILLGEKWCRQCRAWTRRSAFNRDASRGDGLKSRCQACDETPTRLGPGRRDRAMRRAHGEAWCRDCQAWLPTSAVGSSGRCREHHNALFRLRYREDDAFRHQRRMHALARRGVEDVPPDGRERLTEDFGGLCAYCPAIADTIDHLHPVSRGGRTTPGNVVPACRSCNSKKRDREIDDWLDYLEANGVELKPELSDALGFSESCLWG